VTVISTPGASSEARLVGASLLAKQATSLRRYSINLPQGFQNTEGFSRHQEDPSRCWAAVIPIASRLAPTVATASELAGQAPLARFPAFALLASFRLAPSYSLRSMVAFPNVRTLTRFACVASGRAMTNQTTLDRDCRAGHRVIYGELP